MRKEEYLQGILGALGVGTDSGVPDPVWRHEAYLKAIYEAAKDVASTVGETESDVDDLNERVANLEENVDPLGFYRDEAGDLCESDE